jgi:5-formyltetrahydrofolate cyclo-ligase
MISEEKERLRKEALTKRRRLSPITSIQQNLEIERKFFALPGYAAAKTIAFYASKSDEVSTDNLIEKSLKDGKRILLPRIMERDLIWGEIKSMQNLEIGEFAVREPPRGAPTANLKKVDLLVVPLVVCDLKGNRLGHGSGFYDRTLSGFKGVSVGLAFDVQIVPKVPTEEWDERVTKVLTAE